MSKKVKTTPKEELPQGFVLKDSKSTEWKIKNIIGSGGFGYVYCGQLNNNNKLYYRLICINK